MDFTDAGELRVNIAGLPFPHLFFEFILSHSGWRFVDLAFGETKKGLQGALWALGGLPQGRHRQSLGGYPRAHGNERAYPDPALILPCS